MFRQTLISTLMSCTKLRRHVAEIKPLTLTGSFEKSIRCLFRFHLEVKETNPDGLFWGLWEVEDEIECHCGKPDLKYTNR